MGEQRQTPCPALGGRGAQTPLLGAPLRVIPRGEGLSGRDKGSAGSGDAETSVLTPAGVD